MQPRMEGHKKDQRPAEPPRICTSSVALQTNLDFVNCTRLLKKGPIEAELRTYHLRASKPRRTAVSINHIIPILMPVMTMNTGLKIALLNKDG